jgi:GTP-binding protein HflX
MPPAAPGYPGLHRNSGVLNKQLLDGRFDMTVRVKLRKRDFVVSRFDAERKGCEIGRRHRER